MTQLLAAVGTDIRILLRTGYIVATLVVLAILLVIAFQIDRLDFAGFADIIAAIAITDLAVSCTFLVGLMLLLERNEGTIVALAATPMSRTAYLAAKTIAVSVISTAQMILLVLLVYDGALSLPFLFFGLFGIAIITTLLGVVIATPFDTLYRFLLPMIGWSFLLSIPAYSVFFDWRPAWLDFHPLTPSLTILEAAFSTSSNTDIYFGATGIVAWTIISAAAAFWSFGKIRTRASGG